MCSALRASEHPPGGLPGLPVLTRLVRGKGGVVGARLRPGARRCAACVFWSRSWVATFPDPLSLAVARLAGLGWSCGPWSLLVSALAAARRNLPSRSVGSHGPPEAYFRTPSHANRVRGRLGKTFCFHPARVAVPRHSMRLSFGSLSHKGSKTYFPLHFLAECPWELPEMTLFSHPVQVVLATALR